MIWHVCFHPGRDWFGKYRHVSLAGFDNDTWLYLDLHRTGVTSTLIHDYEEVQAFLELLLDNYTVVRFGPARETMRNFFSPMTCVSFVKHTLGVRSSALRPDGLFRILTHEYKAEVMNAPEDSPGQTVRGANPAT